jgi:hypothetical protein
MSSLARTLVRSQAGRRARGQCEPVVWWLRADGEIMPAPHSQMQPFPGYERIETNTLSSISRMSKLMAAQEEKKMRELKVSEQLRALPKWEQIIANCKLRLANGCISKADEAITKSTLASVERKMSLLVSLMSGQGVVGVGCLEIEKREAPTGAAEFQQKKVVVE